MVRSMCKGAFIAAVACGGLALAWAGLAPSQQPKTVRPVPAGIQPDNVLTVHENGKTLQCHVLATWLREDGSRAYDLEEIRTKEKLTVVESGPVSPMKGPQGKIQALPLRIHHWAQSQVRPASAPVPPQPVAL